jgi:hypothetical protein
LENLKGRNHLADGHRWEDIKMILQVRVCEDVHWIYLAQDRVQWWALVSMVMNFGVSKVGLL